MSGSEQFSSRIALLLSTMGMAIGAGNIWRFPRLAGQYGGAFLLPWLLFLFLWSIPLIMVEFAMGKQSRRGPIGAFAHFLGERFAWMGGFVALCTMFIMFYYSVVTGWALKYFTASLTGSLLHADHQAFWERFTGSGLEPVVFHLLALSAGALVISRGVVMGIERANKILLPSLFVLLIIGCIRAVTLPGAEVGLRYYLTVEPDQLLNYKVWLEALSQSAWSTGAGWGLVLTYAVYIREREDITLNSVFTGVGNNVASLFAGLAIIPTVFALSGSLEEAHKALSAGNQGLSFIVIPQLFSQLPGAQLFMAIFFMALFFAALSSLISMLELATRLFMDFGFARKKALTIVYLITLLMGIPSAVSMNVFNNQDWVWGLGLIVSGSFFTFAVLKYGVERFRRTFLDVRYNDLRVGPWFNGLMRGLIPAEALIMLGWWFYQSIQWDPQHWWDPLSPFSLVTCLVQWGVLVACLLVLNHRLAAWLVPIPTDR
ncbi:MAG: sodium-dependent transporter [Calditrichaeota bacterium]|nr:MAG: sodium-dependent transporter [Calditrichota bacterium]